MATLPEDYEPLLQASDLIELRERMQQVHSALSAREIDRHRQEQQLARRVQINYSEYDQRFIGRLEGLHLTVSMNPLVRDEYEATVRELMAIQLARQYMERTEMPTPYVLNPETGEIVDTNTINTAGTTTTAYEAYFPDEEEPVDPPIFTMQQNLQQVELRALRERFPPEIFNRDYQQLPYQALSGMRGNIRDAIYQFRRLQAARHAFVSASPKLRRATHTMLASHINSNDMRLVTSATEPDYTRHRLYGYAIDAIIDYREHRDHFMTNRVRFAAQQAEYNQRAAMVRQRPSRTIVINTRPIVETVSQWENVWGIAAYHNTDEQKLYIRVGMRDIVMSESATDSRYDFQAEILLAPFYITITLSNNGTFVCRSGGGNTRGLSRSDPGNLAHDIHPHQLSDTPCFGTFGQTFVDLALQGDMISLISGLIGFYSQYNSQDSAGIEARGWHPALLYPISNRAHYFDEMYDGITRFADYHICDRTQLVEGINRYCDYFAEARRCESPPERMDRYYCASCDEADVSDDTDYYVSGDERICQGCWNDHYCSDCERHVDDCICNHDDDRY